MNAPEDSHEAGPGRRGRNDNPWQILVVALLFFVPAVPLLFLRGGVLLNASPMNKYGGVSGPVRVETAPAGVAHLFGLAGLLISLGIVVFYFCVRRALNEGGRATGHGEEKDGEGLD